MLRTLIIAAAVLAVLILAPVIMLRPPDVLREYAYLKEPRIRYMNDQKMIMVNIKGDPMLHAREAFLRLYREYYRLPGVSRLRRPPVPRARWPLAPVLPRHEWNGAYGLPVPGTITALPGRIPDSEPKVALGTWKYGEVAEILHAGPYSTESATIEKLASFIAGAGYIVIGAQEEEYLRGPGIFFAGDPEKYATIIRYRIRKPDGQTGPD